MTFALVDCNSFYASCERIFRPDIKKRPVVVLSNNDGCVVALSKEAKQLGIKMCEPWFKIERSFLKKGGVNPIDLNFSNTHLKQYHNFDDFVLRGLNKKEIMEWVHFKPQYTFVCDKNANIVMDFIGKMENLKADFNTVCKHLNVESELQKLNMSSAKKNEFSEEVKAMIKLKYQKDFNLFYPHL